MGGVGVAASLPYAPVRVRQCDAGRPALSAVSTRWIQGPRALFGGIGFITTRSAGARDLSESVHPARRRGTQCSARSTV
jgi:hypothetical protein